LLAWRDSNPRLLQCDRQAVRGKGGKCRPLRLFCAKITIQLAALVAGCYSISVPKLFPDMHRYEARKAIRKPVQWGFDANDVHKKHRLTFLFRSPDQETCPGCFSHP
jgi:hypothetical protein